MDCSLSGSSVHWILQASILEWVATSFSRQSSWSRTWTQVSYIAGEFFTTEPPGKATRTTRETHLPSWQHRLDLWVRKIPWRRKWQFISVFLLGKSHGQRSLVGYSPWGCKRVRHDWSGLAHISVNAQILYVYASIQGFVLKGSCY